MVAAGHSSILAAMAGIRLPIQSHPLQALVSELLEPVHPCVVMSNAVHVYVSQAHKGELVMGAGIDTFNCYAPARLVPIIERQMAALLELFPIFSRAHVLRTWAGIVDVAPDASPIIGLTPDRWPVHQLRLGHRRLQGDPGVRLGPRRTRSPTDEPHPLAEPFALDRFTTGALVDEHGAAAWRAPLMLLIPCPWCGPREEIEFRYGGQAGHRVPGRSGRARRRRVGRLPVPARQPQGRRSGSAGCHRPAAAAGSTSSATR